MFKFQRIFLEIFSSNFYSYNIISDLDLSYDTDLTLSLNAKGTALTNSTRLHTLMRALSMLIIVQVWSPSHWRSHHFYRRNQRGSDVDRRLIKTHTQDTIKLELLPRRLVERQQSPDFITKNGLLNTPGKQHCEGRELLKPPQADIFWLLNM